MPKLTTFFELQNLRIIESLAPKRLSNLKYQTFSGVLYDPTSAASIVVLICNNSFDFIGVILNLHWPMGQYRIWLDIFISVIELQ